MVEAINNVGHIMGITTIAECVETAETLAVLRDIGVDYAQGFGIARPVPYVGLNPLDATVLAEERASPRPTGVRHSL
jgi:EAL domain-containing protein (putative c-di-GMP-specific phosphodiesterase class I)